jgi:chromatin modification-related protein VID21
MELELPVLAEMEEVEGILSQPESPETKKELEHSGEDEEDEEGEPPSAQDEGNGSSEDEDTDLSVSDRTPTPSKVAEEDLQSDSDKSEKEESEGSKTPVVTPQPESRSSSASVVPQKRKRQRSRRSIESGESDGELRNRSMEAKRHHKVVSTTSDDDEESDELDLLSHKQKRSTRTPSDRTSQQPRDIVLRCISEGKMDKEKANVNQKMEEVKAVADAKVVPPTPSTPSQETAQSPGGTQKNTPPERFKAPAHLICTDSTPLPPPKSPAPPIIVQLDVTQAIRQRTYIFPPDTVNTQPGVSVEQSEDETKKPTKPEKKVYSRIVPELQMDMGLTLPPLYTLPPEFNRKGKPQKSKRRDKERSESGKRDDWVPLGMVRWAAMLNANPVHPKMIRASKCLNTKDWNVSNIPPLAQKSTFSYSKVISQTAAKELQLVKSFERIESMKKEGKWSFRQIKKSRVSPGQKTHWDYLMEEMVS